MLEKCVIGDYIVNPKRIGKGAFSSVYAGKDKYDNNVAIKKIEIDSIKKNGERIRKEIKICQTLDHVNVIKTYDVIYDKNGGNIYIITEFCSKGDLSQFLKGRAMKEKYALYFMKQIRSGLKYLIENKIFHRDLKPHNILINEKGELKIADFGFARHFESDNMIETLCGTPLYMAPEIMKKNKYTTKSDLWSVGVILYQMLFGKRPFDAHNILDLLHNIEKNEVHIPRSFNVSDEVIDLLQKLLSKNPENRIEWDDFINHKWFDINLEVNNNQIIKTNNDKNENYEEKNKIMRSFYKFKNLFSNKMKKKEDKKKIVDDNKIKVEEEKQQNDNELDNINNEINENISEDIQKNNIDESNTQENVDNNFKKNILSINETYYSTYKSTMPIPINNKKKEYVPRYEEEQQFMKNKVVDNSPIFNKNSGSMNDFIVISNSDIKMIKKEDKDNYMEKEEESDEENEIGRYYSTSVKDVINNSFDYVKNSMYYFTVYKNTSL